MSDHHHHFTSIYFYKISIIEKCVLLKSLFLSHTLLFLTDIFVTTIAFTFIVNCNKICKYSFSVVNKTTCCHVKRQAYSRRKVYMNAKYILAHFVDCIIKTRLSTYRVKHIIIYSFQTPFVMLLGVILPCWFQKGSKSFQRIMRKFLVALTSGGLSVSFLYWIVLYCQLVLNTLKIYSWCQ